MRYRMEGPTYLPVCFLLGYCGRQTRGTTRLGFYVEVIPHELLTK